MQDCSGFWKDGLERLPVKDLERSYNNFRFDFAFFILIHKLTIGCAKPLLTTLLGLGIDRTKQRSEGYKPVPPFVPSLLLQYGREFRHKLLVSFQGSSI